MLYVHHDITTGKISNWGDGEISAPFLENHAVSRFEDMHMHDVHPTTHRIENGALVLKGPAEQSPALQDVETAIRQDLIATDAFMIPDWPIPDDLRAKWKAYRQALRDLSKLPDATAMVEAWPCRPDSIDPIAHLRERLAAARHSAEA